jgi:hypothetical protein
MGVANSCALDDRVRLSHSALVLALTWVRLPQWVDAVEKAPNCFAQFPAGRRNKRRFLVDIVPIPDMQVVHEDEWELDEIFRICSPG